MTDDPIMTRLRGRLGQKGPVRTSAPVSAADIRRWAIAVYWPETPPRQYWDEAYAATTRWGGIIAPEDLNPFAWLVDRSQRMYQDIEYGPTGQSLNGGVEIDYGVPMRPGDIISAVATPSAISERTGRSGRIILFTTEDVWTNQRGEFVKRYRLTQVLY